MVVAGVFVVREGIGGSIKGEAFGTNVVGNGIKTGDAALKLRLFNLRFEQDVADIHLISALVNQLNDVKTELCAHNLGDFLGVVETEGDIGKFGYPHVSTGVAQLSSHAGGAVFGVEFCQGGEIALAGIDALSEVAQTGFNSFHFLARDLGL